KPAVDVTMSYAVIGPPYYSKDTTGRPFPVQIITFGKALTATGAWQKLGSNAPQEGDSDLAMYADTALRIVRLPPLPPEMLQVYDQGPRSPADSQQQKWHGIYLASNFIAPKTNSPYGVGIGQPPLVLGQCLDWIQNAPDGPHEVNARPYKAGKDLG